MKRISLPLILAAIGAALILVIAAALVESASAQNNPQSLIAPTLLAHVEIPEATMIQVQGNYAAVAAGDKIHILNLKPEFGQPIINQTVRFTGEVNSFVYRRDQAAFWDRDAVHAIVHEAGGQKMLQSVMLKNDTSRSEAAYHYWVSNMWPLGSRYITFEWLTSSDPRSENGQALYDTTYAYPKFIGNWKPELGGGVIGTVDETVFLQNASGVVDVYDLTDPTAPRYRGFLKKKDGRVLAPVDLVIDAGDKHYWVRGVGVDAQVYSVDAETLRVVGQTQVYFYKGPAHRFGRHVLMGGLQGWVQVFDIGLEGEFASKPTAFLQFYDAIHRYVDGRLYGTRRMVLVDEDEGIDIYGWEEQTLQHLYLPAISKQRVEPQQGCAYPPCNQAEADKAFGR